MIDLVQQQLASAPPVVEPLVPGVDDAWSLLLSFALPLAGALFALAMPGADRLGLRYLGMGTSVAAGLVTLRAAWLAASAPLVLTLGPLRLSLDGLSAPLLLCLVIAVPVALRSGAPRIFERTQFYVVTVLFAEGLFAAALVVDSALLRLAIAAVASVPLMALVALFGGPQRGSTTLRAAMIWLLVDVSAIAVVVWLAARSGADVARASAHDLASAAATLPSSLQPWLFLALCAPGLVRLAAGPFSVWLAAFLEEAPVSAVVLASCGAAPLGAHLVLRLALPVAAPGLVVLMPWVCGVGGLAVILSGVIALAERDLRRLMAQLLQAAGSVSALALLTLGDDALAAGVAHVVASGAAAALALTVIEATERRFETRDAVDLAGLGAASPLLATFLVVGMLALVGIPALGAGTSLWAAVSAMSRAPGLAAAGLPPLSSVWLAAAVVAGALCAAAGVAGTARRLLQPAPARKAMKALDELTFWQAARLFVPAAFALAAGLFAGTVVDVGRDEARVIGANARAAAGVTAAHVEISDAPPEARPTLEERDAPAPLPPDDQSTPLEEPAP